MAYAKSDLLLSIPPLLAASNRIDRIADCYSGNFTDNCLGNNVNGIIGIAINADRSFSTVSIFGVESSGKFTEKIHNTYTGSGQNDATGCGSYDITCTDLGYSLSCSYKYANGKTGAIPNANPTQCLPTNQFLNRSLAGSWTFTIQTTTPFSGNYYLNSNSTDSSYIHGYKGSGYAIRAAYSGSTYSDIYSYHLSEDCFRYCPWFDFNYVGANSIEGTYCYHVNPYSPYTCFSFSGNRYSSTVSTLAAARAGHTATLLADGRVLVAGGYGSASLNSAELYYPSANTWSPAAALAAARSSHTATLLADGRVLVAGGVYNGVTLPSAELYDPAANSWSAAGTLAAARDGHTATLLPDGRVLVAGGSSGTGYLVSAELYDPANNTWSAAATLAAARAGHTATLLPDGRVLVAGGGNSAELYDPATNSWTAAGNLAAGRSGHTATLLPDGRVLVAGGYGGTDELAELYDPAANSWSAAGTLASARASHTAALLPDGRVMVAGGEYNSTDKLYSAELYDPATNTWSAADNLAYARSGHTATLLPNGRVMVAGGDGWVAYLAFTELYDPAANTWSLAGNLAVAGNAHTAALLPGGSSGSYGGMQ